MDYSPYLPDSLELAAVSCTVQAGFPSPADDHVSKRMAVLEHLVKLATKEWYRQQHGLKS